MQRIMSRTRRPVSRIPYYTAFRKNPPPWILTILLLAGMVFFETQWKQPAEQPEVMSHTIMTRIEENLLRMEAPQGLDTLLENIQLHNPSESVLRLLQDAQDRHLLEKHALWWKAITEQELGKPEAARKTVHAFEDSAPPIARYVNALLDGKPIGKPLQAGMRVFVKKMPFSWWTWKIAKRSGLAEEIAEKEQALLQQADSIRTARIRLAVIQTALLAVALAGLPLLWRQVRRGVPGITLRPPPGLPPMTKVILGAFAIAGIGAALLDLLIGPAFKVWLVPALKAVSDRTLQVILAVTSLTLILSLSHTLKAWLMGRLCHGRLRLALRYAGARFRDVFHWRTFLTGSALFLSIYTVEMVSQSLLTAFGIGPTYVDFLSRYDPGGFSVLNGILTVIYCLAAPVCEEIVYRGYLLQGLKDRFGFWPTAVLSSAVFSAVHHYSAAGTVHTFLFGLILCAAVHRTGKLSICIVAHFLWNLLVSLNALS